ncbi:ABC transporter permease [Ramlibacter ginsenosidimutans]|uniref:ABC transporter permease n=1 Tax=Ramlibacter ginsenosidimutans TaxID=502333 RepID=A0A934WQ38_9BURK|nr:FtsX-like permease family protein [Ramlibacter ginsenosidimutans]MBK6009381.1 ABC transporter permease [Ramlibacter ginsenosidimutans]
MLALLATYSWQEVRHHAWRSMTAVLAVMLGVALAFSVHLINASALDEFASAARSAGGQPDLELRASQGVMDEALYPRVATDRDVASASPVLELQTFAIARDGSRAGVRVLGVDALVVGSVAPQLVPVPAGDADRLAVLAPATAFLNAAAQAVLPADRVSLQAGLALRPVRVAGTSAAAGGPLLVMDIAAAQDLFGRDGQLSRIDVRLQPGVSHAAWLRRMNLPPQVQAAEPGDAGQRVSQLSRAYRVNLTVLALVALFTGAFLVFSVLALSVARRAQQFALLGVLGLTARERLRLVLAESAVLGVLGSALGIALGTGLAQAALSLLGGDLGGGYFPGVQPQLEWKWWAAAVYGALGVLAALVGGWLPARSAARLPLAQTLKGLGTALPRGRRHRLGWMALLLALALAFLPPIAGIPLAAYLSVALLLVGGIAVLPAAVGALYDRLAPRVANRLLPLLAVERARRVRESAAVAVSGVVAALSLAVALTVMVASFRHSVADWLAVLLPADLYLRTSTSAAAGDTAFLEPRLVQDLAQVPGVARVATQRVRTLLLDPARPPVGLLARPIGDPRRTLPRVGEIVAVPAGAIPVYVSEAMVDLYGARRGARLPVLEKALGAAPLVVAGVWRDYVRQSGAVLLDQRDYLRLTGDTRVNDAQLWLAPGASAQDVQARVRELVTRDTGRPDLVDFASAAEVRNVSLRIFDRSFAVTYWLQAVAIAIGLFGVAASFSAQVLARRKEFGLLAHLGLTRRQILTVVAGEGAAWTVIGALAGLGLGLAVAMVLVHVVNPQSFHWTMDLLVPWGRLLALCLAVIAAGTFTAWAAGRAAAGRDAVLAVKEDW